MSKTKPVRVKPRTYQPNKAEKESQIRLKVPGRTVDTRAERVAEAIFRQTDVQEETEQS